MSSDLEGRPHGPSPRFATTRWSVVLAAADSDAGVARDALARLCASYWYPLYAFLRRRGHGAEDAQDLTQGFFAHLLDRGDVRLADPARGRFRSFLLAACRNYATNHGEAERARKRGGGRAPLSLDAIDFGRAEDRFRHEPADHATPERLFEAAWARELLARVVERLREEFVGRGAGERFEELQRHLAGDGRGDGAPYAATAEALGTSLGSVKVAVHRMRRRYRELLRREIAETLVDPDEVQDELRALFDALSGKRANPG